MHSQYCAPAAVGILGILACMVVIPPVCGQYQNKTCNSELNANYNGSLLANATGRNIGDCCLLCQATAGTRNLEPAVRVLATWWSPIYLNSRQDSETCKLSAQKVNGSEKDNLGLLLPKCSIYDSCWSPLLQAKMPKSSS